MRSRGEKTMWTVLALLLLAGVGAAWWTRDDWGPEAGPATQKLWLKATRPGPETLPPNAKPAAPAQAAASEPPPRPRKCVQGTRITYTDQPCPPGSQERPMDAGSVTSLPRQ